MAFKLFFWALIRTGNPQYAGNYLVVTWYFIKVITSDVFKLEIQAFQTQSQAFLRLKKCPKVWYLALVWFEKLDFRAVWHNNRAFQAQKKFEKAWFWALVGLEYTPIQNSISFQIFEFLTPLPSIIVVVSKTLWKGATILDLAKSKAVPKAIFKMKLKKGFHTLLEICSGHSINSQFLLCYCQFWELAWSTLTTEFLKKLMCNGNISGNFK